MRSMTSLAAIKSVSQPPKAVVKLNLPSEKAPAPPKPHMVSQTWNSGRTRSTLPETMGQLAAVDVRALIHHQHIQLGAELLELVTGKDAGLAAANDRNIITGVHQFDSILQYSFGGALETS